MTGRKEALKTLDNMVKHVRHHLYICQRGQFDERIETIRKALQAPGVDIDELKQDEENSESIAECRINRGWNDCIDHLIEHGLLRVKEREINSINNGETP